MRRFAFVVGLALLCSLVMGVIFAVVLTLLVQAELQPPPVLNP